MKSRSRIAHPRLDLEAENIQSISGFVYHMVDSSVVTSHHLNMRESMSECIFETSSFQSSDYLKIGIK